MICGRIRILRSSGTGSLASPKGPDTLIPQHPDDPCFLVLRTKRQGAQIQFPALGRCQLLCVSSFPGCSPGMNPIIQIE